MSTKWLRIILQKNYNILKKFDLNTREKLSFSYERDCKSSNEEYRPCLILQRILSPVVSARDEVKIRRIFRTKGRCGLRREPEWSKGLDDEIVDAGLWIPEGTRRKRRTVTRSFICVPFLSCFVLCVYAYNLTVTNNVKREW